MKRVLAFSIQILTFSIHILAAGVIVLLFKGFSQFWLWKEDFSPPRSRIYLYSPKKSFISAKFFFWLLLFQDFGFYYSKRSLIPYIKLYKLPASVTLIIVIIIRLVADQYIFLLLFFRKLQVGIVNDYSLHFSWHLFFYL